MEYSTLKQNYQRIWITSFYCKQSKIQPCESDSSSQEVILCSSNTPHDFIGLLLEKKKLHVSEALNNAKSSCTACFQVFTLLLNFKCWLQVAGEHLSCPQQIDLLPAKCFIPSLKLLDYYLYFHHLEPKQSARGQRLKAPAAYLIIKKHNNEGLGADNCPFFFPVWESPALTGSQTVLSLPIEG